MDFQARLNNIKGFQNLELLASQVVEGFISGMHKSPFHGFSAEFAEHKVYNAGESTKHIDWKLYARTDKLYTKRYEEETNLRCHFILDASSSMHYPALESVSQQGLNKISFSALAIAAIIQLMKKQRDAVGLSVFSESFDFFAPEKGGERHRHMLLLALNEAIITAQSPKKTNVASTLPLIAEKLKRRSLVFIFSDMLQNSPDEEALFGALQHLKYKKHEVVLFHTIDKKTEQDFDYDNSPRRFTDVETGEQINVFADTIREVYTDAATAYFDELKLRCAKYKVKYVPVDIRQSFAQILTTFLVERRQFL
ncbi:MAG: DUF58 domain-containing protein [Leeuwenhoekiella sp.]